MNQAKIGAESIYSSRDDTKKLGNYYRAVYPLNPDVAVFPFELKASKDVAYKLSVESAIGSGLVQNMVNGTVGDELTLETNVSSNILTINKQKIAKNSAMIEEYWNLWSQNPEACDVNGEQTLGAMVRIATFNAYATGDVLQYIGLRKWNGVFVPTVRFYDGRSVANEDGADNTDTMVNGVRIGRGGETVGYTIKTEKTRNNFEYKNVKSRVKYPGADFERLQYNLITTSMVQPNQKRGRPLLLPVMEDLIMMEKFNDAELVKAVVQSYITAFIERDKELISHGVDTADDPLLGQLQDDKKPGETGTYDKPITMGPGYVVTLNPGETITMAESKSPQTEFWKFMEGNLKTVSMGVQIPYEVALQTFNSNYSASQAAIQAAARRWDIDRRLFAAQIMKPVYDLFVYLMVYQGIINCPGYMDDPFTRAAWNNARWHGPVILNIDPIKNATAATLRLNNHTSTYEDESRALGKDFDKIADRRSQEEALLKSLGLTPNLAVEKKDVEPEEGSNE